MEIRKISSPDEALKWLKDVSIIDTQGSHCLITLAHSNRYCAVPHLCPRLPPHPPGHVYPECPLPLGCV